MVLYQAVSPCPFRGNHLLGADQQNGRSLVILRANDFIAVGAIFSIITRRQQKRNDNATRTTSQVDSLLRGYNDLWSYKLREESLRLADRSTLRRMILAAIKGDTWRDSLLECSSSFAQAGHEFQSEEGGRNSSMPLPMTSRDRSSSRSFNARANQLIPPSRSATLRWR